jgi:hypothetical protein
MYAHLKQHSKQKTKERNSKQILVEQKKWIEIDELVAVTEKEYQAVIKLEERSRMLSKSSSCCSNSHQLISQAKISSKFVTFFCCASRRFARRCGHRIGISSSPPNQ